MKYQSPLPSAEYLRELFFYDPSTGILSWKVQRNWRTPVGSEAGRKRRDGYLSVKIDQCDRLVHRLIWVISHGYSPTGMIDHIDGKRSNNRIDNLRIVDDHQNSWNSASQPKRTADHSYTGVYRSSSGDSWQARIVFRGVTEHLGIFKTPQEASQAYQSAAAELRGEFFRNSITSNQLCPSDRDPPDKPRFKISEAQVTEILHSPLSAPKLAPLYGVEKSTIQRIRNGTRRRVNRRKSSAVLSQPSRTGDGVAGD